MGFSLTTSKKGPLGCERGDVRGLGHVYGNRCGEKLFCNRMVFATLKLRREMGPKFFCKCFWDRSRGRAGRVLASFFSMSLVTIPDVFAKVNSAQFLSRC